MRVLVALIGARTCRGFCAAAYGMNDAFFDEYDGTKWTAKVQVSKPSTTAQALPPNIGELLMHS